MKKSLILSGLLLSVCFSGWVNGETEVTEPAQHKTIYLIRHAEKSHDDARDPNLSDQGLQRADRLARFFVNKRLSAVFSSNYKRTLQTAKPTLDSIGLGVQLYDPSRLAEFAEALKQTPGNILVVGHSNTTPELARLLGFAEATTQEGNVEDWRVIDESDFSRIYQIQFNGERIVAWLLSSDGLESRVN